MKRIIIIHFVLLCILSTAFAQLVYVPLNHWVYDFIERLETKKIIPNVLNNTKPFTRKEIAGYLRELIKQNESAHILNRVEQEQLDFLKLEFMSF